jgi:hypothetical protein
MVKNELQIIEYRPTAAALAELGGRYKGVVFQVDNTKGMADAKAARAEIRGYRTDLEKLRKELKADVLEKGRLIDGEAKRITLALEELEDPIDSQIKAEEARKEAERKAKEEAERAAADEIQKRIAEIRNWPSRFIGCSSARISEELETMAFDIDDIESFGLYAGMAKQAQAECVATMETMLGKAIAHEQEQARLEAERVELARIQAEQQAQIEADRAELAKLQAEQAERAKAEDEARAERERLQAERAKQDAELQAQREADAERMRLDCEKYKNELKAQRDEAARIEAENLQARQESEAKAKADAKAQAERNENLRQRMANLRQRLAEIQAKDTPIENKLMLAYHMGRGDLAVELELKINK